MKHSVVTGLLMFSASLLYADANYEVDGYIRGTYQHHDVKEYRVYMDDAIGGKIHFETASTDGISLGASLYGSQALFHDDNQAFVPLRGENHKSYAIVGEAYLKGKFGKTVLNLGRQEIETVNP